MRQEVVKTLAALITAAFGLVAALAWNTAIQEIFKTVFGQQSTLLAEITYAAIVTVISVIATVIIGKIVDRAGVKDEKSAAVKESEALRAELQALREELKRLRADAA